MSARRSRGLTLVEMLVAILLVALAASLVVQGIGQGAALLRRVAADQGEIYGELMARAWLRQTLEAAVAPTGEERGFEGDALQVRLVSFRPLLGSEGIATELQWRADDAGLDYLEGNQSMRIEALPPVHHIEYQDEAGNWQPRWPAEDEDSGLPQRVRLVFGGDDYLDVTLVTRHAALADDDELAPDRD